MDASQTKLHRSGPLYVGLISQFFITAGKLALSLNSWYTNWNDDLVRFTTSSPTTKYNLLHKLSYICFAKPWHFVKVKINSTSSADSSSINSKFLHAINCVPSKRHARIFSWIHIIGTIIRPSNVSKTWLRKADKVRKVHLSHILEHMVPYGRYSK